MKLLIISRDCFSKTNANGKTLESLLCSFKKEELMQFYTGVDNPDFGFCYSYFRITDMQMMKSFIKSPVVTVEKVCNTVALNIKSEQTSELKIWASLKKLNYNFAVRYLRELLWKVSPRWKKKFYQWIEKEHPTAIMYMVGDSFYLDNLVLNISKRYNIPIILFNVEAYRIINCKERTGFDCLYNKKSERSYEKIQKQSALTIYNCNLLKESYQKFYSISEENAQIAYNAYTFDMERYTPVEGRCNIEYFGNLGVGRVSSLIDIANVLKKIAPELKINVYGCAPEKEEPFLRDHSHINYHGLVSQDVLTKVKQNADILLQVESFDPDIMKKLRYAFSTKIAQCLCAGRALLSYAPIETASTIYLKEETAAVIADDMESLKSELSRLIHESNYRKVWADRALEVAHANHDSASIGVSVRKQIEQLI